MSDIICPNGHVVDTGADHCQRCNVKIISPNETKMDEANAQNENVEETPTPESSPEESDETEESTDTESDGEATPTV